MPPPDFSEALIAAYTFDDGTAVDASGNGNDGDVVGAEPTEGKINQGLLFDGSDDTYVDVPDLGEHLDLTITAWFKATGRVGDWRVIYNGNGWSQGWVHHQIHPNNRMEYSIHSNPGGNDQFGETVFDDAELEVWHHSAVVYSGTEQTIKFYVDGELDGEADWGGDPAVLVEARIGGWDSGGRGFEGVLDEIYLIGAAATEDQVKALMEGGLSSSAPFQIEKIAHVPAGDGTPAQTELTWNSVSGATYIVDTSTDLIEFVELTDGFPSEGETTTFIHENPEGETRYYRVSRE